jgi:hypothetical protein
MTGSVGAATRRVGGDIAVPFVALCEGGADSAV